MEKQDVKARIMYLVSDEKLEPAICTLRATILSYELIDKGIANNLYKDIILLEGGYNDIKHHEMLGLLTIEDALVNKNRVRKRLLDFMDYLPMEVYLSYDSLSHNFNLTDNIITRSNIIMQTDLNSESYDYDIYISYGKNYNQVSKIATHLRGHGFRVLCSNEVYRNKNISLQYIKEYIFKSKNFLLLSDNQLFNSEINKIESNTFYNDYFLEDMKNRKFIVLGRQNKNLLDFYRKSLIVESLSDIPKLMLDYEYYKMLKSKQTNELFKKYFGKNNYDTLPDIDRLINPYFRAGMCVFLYTLDWHYVKEKLKSIRLHNNYFDTNKHVLLMFDLVGNLVVGVGKSNAKIELSLFDYSYAIIIGAFDKEKGRLFDSIVVVCHEVCGRIKEMHSQDDLIDVFPK